MKKLVKIISARLDSYWYAGHIGETYWVNESDDCDSYRVIDDCEGGKWIDKIDSQEIYDGQEHLIGINEARVLQKSGGVFASKPTDFGKLDLPDDFIAAYKHFIHAKEAFNYILRKYEFVEL